MPTMDEYLAGVGSGRWPAHLKEFGIKCCLPAVFAAIALSVPINAPLPPVPRYNRAGLSRSMLRLEQFKSDRPWF